MRFGLCEVHHLSIVVDKFEATGNSFQKISRFQCSAHLTILLGTTLLLQETHIEQLNARRAEICETCELDQIKLPTQETDSMAIDSAGSSQQIISSSSSFDYSKLSKPHQQV